MSVKGLFFVTGSAAPSLPNYTAGCAGRSLPRDLPVSMTTVLINHLQGLWVVMETAEGIRQP